MIVAITANLTTSTFIFYYRYLLSREKEPS
jgi:hypothetical protein